MGVVHEIQGSIQKNIHFISVLYVDSDTHLFHQMIPLSIGVRKGKIIPCDKFDSNAIDICPVLWRHCCDSHPDWEYIHENITPTVS